MRAIRHAVIALLFAGWIVACSTTRSSDPSPAPSPVPSYTPATIPSSAPSASALVGIWQASPSMGSGWNDTYRFWKDGRFRFHTSQMNCSAREIGYAGSWQIEGQQLILYIVERSVIEGGTLAPAGPACATQYEIVGGNLAVQSLYVPEKKTLALSEIKMDDFGYDLKRPTVFIADQQYWQFDTDPEAYPESSPTR
ncbi:MAG: hypothetical protein RMN52_04155 [Anaerolineae bacterium]|nr:hypothetical protein [Candidatus Roseilinea sp.]MDW8449176.1 hypothetical protein [Anaerolineae bacterium]